MSQQVLALVAIRDVTNHAGWTRNQEGWVLLEGGMTGLQAMVCKPSGVTFDVDGTVLKVDLCYSGLTGNLG